MEGQTQLAITPVEDFENGDFLMATKILTSRIRHDPNNYELYLERSVCHHKLGNYQASLDDADAAVRLNPSDYNVHYQKSLALIRLYMFDDALRSALKAIELRAGRSDTKMSDIFKLIKDHIREMKIVREQLGDNGLQQQQQHHHHHQQQQQHQQVKASDFGETATTTTSSNNNPAFENRLGTSGEPVDSTTDRLSSRPSPQGNINTSNRDNIIGNNSSNINNKNKNNNNNNNNNLVMTNCNNNRSAIDSQAVSNQMVLSTGSVANKVSSSAIRCGNIDGSNIHDNNKMSSSSSMNQPTDRHVSNIDVSMDPHSHGDLNDHCRSSSQFEWNIRRSERIFLHNTNEPGTSSPQPTSDHGGRTTFGSHLKHSGKTSSNPSSVGSVSKSLNRQSHKTYANNNGTNNSHLDSDVDVEDTNSELQRPQIIVTSNNHANNQNKRVMVAPSSSMPATSQVTTQNASTPKDDSYSSKYKRLRRDRERARRGTSKLCTIKPSDLEDLHQAGSDKRFMRVIAPIDGWLYSGQLSLDDGPRDSMGLSHYVVKLDGDSSGSSYLFTQDTVLNDVIKEVRVKSVSDLRKGARICCYWSRTYKCLSTGVVTSRTFEATKSLVSVKYDNGDLSALPLEDLRLLPPDYPKYMSNCDPLLLARNGDGITMPSEHANLGGATRIVVAGKSTKANADSPTLPIVASSQIELDQSDDTITELSDDNKLKIDESCVEFQPIDQDDSDDDEAIPPTNQAIDFITNEDIGTDSEDETDEQNSRRLADSKDNMMLANETSPNAITNTSRVSSEENNFGVEYRPWIFNGPPESKRKRHGRTYRDNYMSIRRGNEILRIGDSAELMPRDASVLPFIAKIDGLWGTGRGEMRVRVRWYYRLVETEGEPCDLKDGENALFETDHFDENDVQSIWRASKILSWTDYSNSHLGHVNEQNEGPKIFYLAGYYDPVRRIKHLRSDVKERQ